jgi:hypothetical protein
MAEIIVFLLFIPNWEGDGMLAAHGPLKQISKADGNYLLPSMICEILNASSPCPDYKNLWQEQIKEIKICGRFSVRLLFIMCQRRDN